MQLQGKSTLEYIVAQGYVRHLEFCIEVGLVRRAKQVLRILSQFTLAGCPDFVASIDRAKNWTDDAIAYERQHGSGAMLDRTHPLLKEYQQRALNRRRGE